VFLRCGRERRIDHDDDALWRTVHLAVHLTGAAKQKFARNRVPLSAQSMGGALTSVQLTRDPGDTARTVHLYGNLIDWGGNASKVWWFDTSSGSPSVGLQTAYEGRQLPNYNALTHNDYTWTTDTGVGGVGNPYISSTLTTTGSAQKVTSQDLDK